MGFFDFMKKSEPAENEPSFDPVEQAEPWFRKHAINLDSINFGIYEDNNLVEHPGAIVLVGTADNDQNENLGFAIEVVLGKGVVNDLFIEPAIIATKHLFASIEAQAKKVTIIDALKYLMKLNQHSRMTQGRDMESFGGRLYESSQESSENQQGAQNLLLQPGTTAPAIVNAKSVKSCACEEFVGLVSIDIESVPPIDYSFILTVFKNGGDYPVLFVTAEKNTMRGLMGLNNGEPKELESSDLFLGVFDQHGHHNMGKFKDIMTIEGFMDRAVPVMRESLGIHPEAIAKIENVVQE